MNTKAFIFDLDGVIVDTAKYHYLAWLKIANELGIEFTHEHNELLKGVSRVRSLDIILGLGEVEASQAQKEQWLIQKKIYIRVDPCNTYIDDTNMTLDEYMNSRRNMSIFKQCIYNLGNKYRIGFHAFKMSFFEGSARVPLMISAPGRFAPALVSSPASTLAACVACV